MTTKTVAGARQILCAEQAPDACGMVIFGASGDLTKRKLLPAIFSLYCRNLLPANFFLLGFARTPTTDDEFRAEVEAMLPAENSAEAARRREFAARCHYQAGGYKDEAAYQALAERLTALGTAAGTGGNILFYLSTPPELCGPIVRALHGAGLTQRQRLGRGPWRRIIIEKPFGHDLKSAVALDRMLHGKLAENQIYRIDHYLGKETVQNILMFRFANTVFEPVWNRNFVDHVQITVAESIGVGKRAGYFDSSGLLRDMFQNHMLQLFSLVAMEAPASFSPDQVRDEKVKLLRAVRPFTQASIRSDVVRGQYGRGRVGNEDVPAYLDEPDIPAASATETFVAMKLAVDNWRWQGVPFYLRSGKRLRRKLSEIAICFKPVPHSIFNPIGPDDLAPNTLVIRVQPEEGVELNIQAKRPGSKLCMGDLSLDFNYQEIFGGEPPDAYERLILDAMLGDQTLFSRQDSVAESWELLMPVLEAWQAAGRHGTPDLHEYAAGGAGPGAADALLARAGHAWRYI